MDSYKTTYAVIRLDAQERQRNFTFTLWHETLDAAKAEAERLARQSNSAFMVIQSVGFMRPTSPPVEWKECE